MKTTLEVIDIIWQLLNGSPLADAITGGVYKNLRPLNTAKEDVVINCLPVNNAQLQQGVANVNIHVPNLILNVNGVQDKTQPNHARLQLLTGLAIQELLNVWEGDYNLDIEQQTIFADEEANSHYSNIRIQFNNINLSN